MIHTIDLWAIRLMWIPRIVIVAGLLSLAWFAADRKPPFEVLGVDEATVQPGGTVRLYATVRREAHRNCAADFSRYLYTVDGVRYDLGASTASASMISSLDLRAPGRLSLAIHIPQGAAPGPAKIVTVLSYRCNAVHTLWPIQVTTEMPFTIEPAP